MDDSRNEITYIKLLIRELETLLKEKEEQRSKKQIPLFEPGSQHLIYHTNTEIHFSLNKKQKLLERKKHGTSTVFDTDKKLENIKNEIGYNKWEKFVKELFDLYPNFVSYNTNLSSLNTSIKEQIKHSRKLAELISENNLFKYTDLKSSPFIGLLTKHIINQPLIEAIRLLDKIEPNFENDDIAMGIFMNMIDQNPLYDLSDILSDYADIVESTFTENHTKQLKDTQYYSKKDFTRYLKLNVFNSLYYYWPKFDPPYTETALISNLILGLKGKDKITNENIRKMQGKMTEREKAIQLNKKRNFF